MCRHFEQFSDFCAYSYTQLIVLFVKLTRAYFTVTCAPCLLPPSPSPLSPSPPPPPPHAHAPFIPLPHRLYLAATPPLPPPPAFSLYAQLLLVLSGFSSSFLRNFVAVVGWWGQTLG
jgi:hypothetical protein